MHLLGLIIHPLNAEIMTIKRTVRKKYLFKVGKYELTFEDIMSGVFITGMTGSGKTSGSGRYLLDGMLNLDMGGIMLTAKPEDTKDYAEIVRKAGRGKDLIIVSPEKGYCFNFIDEEAKRNAPLDDIIKIISDFINIVDGVNLYEESGDPFWKEARETAIKKSIQLLVMADEAITTQNIAKLLKSGPQSTKEKNSVSWRKDSYCYSCLKRAADKALPSYDTGFKEALEYFIEDFARIPSKTRESVITTVINKLEKLSSGITGRFLWGKTNITPLAALSGKIFILDFPVKTYGSSGANIQKIFKYALQKEAERNPEADWRKPAFIWADEAQFFVFQKDLDFQTTARSAKVATVYMTQNLDAFYVFMGKGEDAKRRVQGIIGNLALKIFHNNDNLETNRYAADVIGKETRYKVSSGMQNNKAQDGSSSNVGFTEDYQYIVEPDEFLKLKKGGKYYNKEVEAFFVFPRTLDEDNTRHLKISFTQKPL